PAFEQAAGKYGEEDERREAAEEREEPQRVFALPEEMRQPLLDEQEAGRRRHRERKRPKERACGAIDDAERNSGLVVPQGTVRRVLEDPDRAPEHDRGRDDGIGAERPAAHGRSGGHLPLTRTHASNHVSTSS